MENTKLSFAFPSPIHSSSPNNTVFDYSNPQNLEPEIEFEICVNRNLMLEKSVEKLESEIVQLRKISRHPRLPTQEVVARCKITAGNDFGFFVRNILSYLYPKHMLEKFSLSGRDGRNKVPKQIKDFVVEKCMMLYPESKRKMILKMCANFFANGRQGHVKAEQ
jgi:hypothetical protein